MVHTGRHNIHKWNLFEIFSNWKHKEVLRPVKWELQTFGKKKKQIKIVITHLLNTYHLINIRLIFSHILFHFIFIITPWHNVYLTPFSHGEIQSQRS